MEEKIQKRRTIKRAAPRKLYDLNRLMISLDKEWWELSEPFLDDFETIEEAREYIKNVDNTPKNLLGYSIEKKTDDSPTYVETYDSEGNLIAQYKHQLRVRGAENLHEPCKFAVGEKVLAILHAPYHAVIPCEVLGHISEGSEREDWELNAPKDFYSTYEEYVESWDDWHWDFMVVRPLVKLKSMPTMVTVPRIYLFPYREL